MSVDCLGDSDGFDTMGTKDKDPVTPPVFKTKVV